MNKEWETEPDRVDFEHAGYPCMILRSPVTGALCGYVGVGKEHPLYEKDYSTFYDEGIKINVHGGLTYSDKCNGHICHEPKPGQSDNIWWLGFDCAHACDVSPAMLEVRTLARKTGFKSPLGLSDEQIDEMYEQMETYKNIAYVTEECKNLAEQCKAKELK